MSKQPPETAVTVVDYGAGNLRSVQRALEAAGQQPIVTSDAHDIERAQGLVLPGVGSANDSMKALQALDLVAPLLAYVASGRPFLGVCLGLQLLFDWCEEGGGTACLGVLPGVVRRFPADATLKVPHMGWNTVSWRRRHPLFDGIPNASHYYFVHSYYVDPANSDGVVGETEYGVTFASVVAQANVVATQFHPEKSAALGLRLYQRFADSVRLGAAREPLLSGEAARPA